MLLALRVLRGRPLLAPFLLRPAHTPAFSSARRKWSANWASDPYVAKAHAQGLRSRAALKLAEIDDRFRILRPGSVVVDLGAAPGGWSMVASQRLNPGAKGAPPHPESLLVCVDLCEMDPVDHAEFVRGDFTWPETGAMVRGVIGGRQVDTILSDMAPQVSGNKRTDHARSVALCRLALDFGRKVLRPAGTSTFVCKVFGGAEERALVDELKRDFRVVRRIKPDASRRQSVEMFLFCRGYHPGKGAAGGGGGGGGGGEDDDKDESEGS